MSARRFSAACILHSVEVPKMNAYERTTRLLKDEPVDRLPVQPICMTFAARVAGVRYYDYVTDYRVLVDAQIQTYDTFGFDVVTLCSDPCREAVDCGATVRWFDDAPPAYDPNLSLLKHKTQLRTLKEPDPLGGGRMHDRVKGAALLREKIGGEVPILGWVEGPMAEAVDLRSFNVMLDMMDDPPFVVDLLEFITAMEISFARAQVEAGADMIGIGDAAASLVGPEVYHKYVLPYQKKLIDAIHGIGAMVRLHICGRIDQLLDGINTLDLEIVDVDFLTNLQRARDELTSDVAILGNIEPVRYLLESTPNEVYQAIAECHRIVGDKYVVGPGCEVPAQSPYENVRAMIQYAERRNKSYPKRC